MPTPNEKVVSSDRIEQIPPPRNSILFTATVDPSKKSFDKAHDYLQHHGGILAETEVDLHRLLRKIDWRIMPIMWFIFGIQYLDKFLLNYAIIMGMPKDLKLEGEQLNNIASALWWAYLAWSPAVAFLLNKLPVGKWLGVNMVLWGVVISCTAAVKRYPHLMGLRILMGIFDAAIAPALMLISSQYYRKDEQAARFALWFSSIGTAIIIGGAVSYGFQGVHSTVLESWRIMYLVLGLISFVVGLWCLFFMPDTPMECKFLTEAEKTAILHHVSVNKTGIVNRKIEWHQLRELAIDPQIWLIAGGTVIISLGSGILGTYASTLIKNFGYTSKQASLLNMPGGAIAIVSTLGFGWIIRHHYLTRWAASIIGYALALVGAGLVAFAPHHNKAAQLVGIWMVSFSIFTSSIKFSWIAANVAGHTKRSAATALVSGAVSVGNIMAPYAVQPKDAPRYQTGRLVLFGSKATAICILTLLFFYYKFANKQRDRRYGAVRSDSMARELGIEEEVTAEEASETWANVTDMEKKTFRYVL